MIHKKQYIVLKYFYIIILIYKSSLLISQSRVILNNNPYIVIENSALLVIRDSSANAITVSGTGGNIVSEGENNKVKWYIGNSTGNYTVPFSSKTGAKIPLIVDVIGSGIGSGNILFSTYGGGWNNSSYLPNDVNSISSTCCSDNSANVIDRFWLIDATNFTQKPSVSITFTYIDLEHSDASNTIIESSLFAQRFNPAPINNWGDWLGKYGTANTTNNTVRSDTVTSANFFRSWTLVNQNNPLPIELVNFKALCDGKNLNFEWETATEKNNAFFSIEKSIDAVNWSEMARVTGNGNSTSTKKYTYNSINEYGNTLYFRLKQVDNNGDYSYSKIAYTDCNLNNNQIITEYPNPSNGIVTVNLEGYEKQLLKIEIHNSLGELIQEKDVLIDNSSQKEIFNLKNIPPGIYMLSIKDQQNIKTKNIIIY